VINQKKPDSAGQGGIFVVPPLYPTGQDGNFCVPLKLSVRPLNLDRLPLDIPAGTSRTGVCRGE
jgi:hypothetical protein